MTATTRRITIFAMFAALLLSPQLAFGWGAGMHATLTAHGHDRMTQRWKAALDRNLLIFGSFGPDVWYIQKVGEEAELVCPVACGPDDGRISNECWGHYANGPDRYFAYARQLLVNADSLAAISWAFGYAAHAVEDWRGHMEYIIPDWVNPGSGMKNRHTLVDSSGAVLAYNVDGLYGYPSSYTMDRTVFGYPDGGFLDANNTGATGGRDARVGLGLEVYEKNGEMRIRYQGALSEELTGLSVEVLGLMADNASLGSAAEGILAAHYGITGRYDSLGNDWPIVTENGAVAIDCGTDFRSRLISAEGAGYPFACQIYNASLLSGVVYGAAKPSIWFNYLKPADDGSDNIVVDKDQVALWMDRFANHFEWDGVRLDDSAVFGIDPQTGLSTKHLLGIDGREFTFGRSLPEIVGEVLELSVQDLVERLFEQPAFLGAVLQSRLSPTDKARFVAFDFHYRPRLSAWPDSLDYAGESIALHPGAPGPFAAYEVAIDVSAESVNPAPEMVFPYYLIELRVETETASGTGRLACEIAYRGEDGAPIGEAIADIALDLEAGTLADPDGNAFVELTDATTTTVRIVLDNTAGGWHVYDPQAIPATLVAAFSLSITDGERPPFDYLIDTRITPYCERPDLQAPGDAATDNSLCPLDEPDFPEPDGDTDADSEDGDAELDGDMADGDMSDGDAADGDADELIVSDGDVPDGDEADGDAADGDTPAESDGGGCAQTTTPGGALLMLLTLGLLFKRRHAR